ncbi:hypothetical protein PybrP1_006223 [[Pythium] brassicae (nom. inval.)]|nr:hypothetical protein PybrP1_006223 [[Pythium] brassicae (nom. inval.)]
MVLSRIARAGIALAAFSFIASSFVNLPTVSGAGLTCGDGNADSSGSSPPSPGGGANGNSTASGGKLPIFYFHGSSGSAENSVNHRANLTAEGRTFVALEFCAGTCSTKTGLNEQVAMGVKNVRSVIAANPEVYKDGYIFIGHSQGGSVAKFVIQEMDDHKVKTFVSLASSGNGRFYGPQPEDAVPMSIAASLIGPQIPQSIFNASAYSDPATWNGKFQRELLAAIFDHPELQASIPQFNQARSPYVAPWLAVNPLFPRYHNLVECSGAPDAVRQCRADQKRYKDNFVRVNNIHLFASPNDSVQAPYQTGLYGFYSNVASLEAVETEFQSLKMLDMTETPEYLGDTYGLQTLHKAGRLHRHSVPMVDHNCWNRNSTDFKWECLWEPVYAKHIYPLL